MLVLRFVFVSTDAATVAAADREPTKSAWNHDVRLVVSCYSPAVVFPSSIYGVRIVRSSNERIIKGTTKIDDVRMFMMILSPAPVLLRGFLTIVVPGHFMLIPRWRTAPYKNKIRERFFFFNFATRRFLR